MPNETNLTSSYFTYGAGPDAAPATYVAALHTMAPSTLTAPIHGEGGRISHHVRLKLVSPQRQVIHVTPDPMAFRTLVGEALLPLLARVDHQRRSDEVLAIEDSLRDLRGLITTSAASTDLRDRYGGEVVDVVRRLTAMLRPAIRDLVAELERCGRVDYLTGRLERSQALHIVHLVGGAWLLHLALAPQATVDEEKLAIAAYLERCALLEKVMADAINLCRNALESERHWRRDQKQDWYAHEQFERAFEEGMTRCDDAADDAAQRIRWFAAYLRSAVALDVRMRCTVPNLIDMASTLGGLGVESVALNPSTLAPGAAARSDNQIPILARP